MQLIVWRCMCSLGKCLLKPLSSDTFCPKHQELIGHYHKSYNCKEKTHGNGIPMNIIFRSALPEIPLAQASTTAHRLHSHVHVATGLAALEAEGISHSLEGWIFLSILVLQKDLDWSAWEKSF